MRFMLLIFSAETLADMSRYDQALSRAGVLLCREGLHPPAVGARLTFSDRKASVVDGPLAEAKEAIAGYWLIQAKSKEEAVEWARRCPARDGDTLEVRQVREPSLAPRL